MATVTSQDRFVINESSAQKILSTPRTVIKESNVFNDIKMNNKERIAHAANVLKSRKCK
ncbi:hypothetical protein [Bacillus sp. FJAT-47783]|uniref:hypothetical protein n=1 Tax=Bacillus sp. FJAT-47783 TaxID=2922712 RepID=UPI001FABCDC2|nr:hypothetical protein [Bacillus sp. FJAT-47783]